MVNSRTSACLIGNNLCKRAAHPEASSLLVAATQHRQAAALSHHGVYLCLCWCRCLCISVSLSLHPSIHPRIRLCLSARLPAYLPVLSVGAFLALCKSVWPLFFCLSDLLLSLSVKLESHLSFLCDSEVPVRCMVLGATYPREALSSLELGPAWQRALNDFHSKR